MKALEWVVDNAEKPAVVTLSINADQDEMLDECVKKVCSATACYQANFATTIYC